MTGPRIGLSMLFMLSQPFTKMTQNLSKIDTNYIEIVDDGMHALNSKRVKILNEIAKTKNMHFSVHAPFADINVASPSQTMLRASMKRLKQSLKHAYDLEAYLWVFHPGGKSGISAFYPGLDWKQNAASIKELSKAAKDYGLKIAMENLPEKYNFLMKTPEDFSKFYQETKLSEISIVLDTGHANLEAQIDPFLKQLPNKISHVHISDNHGVIDEHLGLGYGLINWQKFAKELKATGFSGTILAESVFNVQETIKQLQLLFA